MSETTEREAVLLAEIDRLHLANKDAIDHYADARAEINHLRAELAEARAAIARVRTLHFVEHECNAVMPCPMLRALDGDA